MGWKDALPIAARKYPHLKFLQTEQECGNGKNDWNGAVHSWDLMKHYLSHGVSVLYLLEYILKARRYQPLGMGSEFLGGGK